MEQQELNVCAGCAAHIDTNAPLSPAIDRRGFIVQSAILAAAAALAACGSSDATAPAISSGSTVKVSDFSSLSSVGGIAITSLNGAPIAVVRTGASSFLVLSRICPHQGGTIEQAGSGFQCPVHGAQFNSNGTWTGGQRTSSMHVYASSYDPTTNIITLT